MPHPRNVALAAMALWLGAIGAPAFVVVAPHSSLSAFSKHASRQPHEHHLLGYRNAGARKARGVQGLSASIPSDLKGRERLEKFLGDCALLGPTRFVSVTDGAILEAVGSFDNLRYTDLPKGRYATVSEGKGFECHLNCDKVKSIKMVTKQSPGGSFDLYITRFLDEEGNTLLSAMLHGVDGAYEPGAAGYWDKLRKTFGEDQSVA
ncbi:unnamed protein product [Ectocarpus sp. 6 AP-2014]